MAVTPLLWTDLFQPEWASNPYELYRQLRERNSIYRDEWMRTWVILGYDESRGSARTSGCPAHGSPSFYEQLPVQARAGIGPLAEALSDMMLFNEPPRHTRLRRLIKPAHARFIRGMRPAIEALADELLDRVTAAGRWTCRQLPEPLTRGMIAYLSGPPARRSPAGTLPGLCTKSSPADQVVPRLAELRSAFDEQAARAAAGTGHRPVQPDDRRRLAAETSPTTRSSHNYCC